MSTPGTDNGRALGPAEVLSEEEIRALLAQFSRRSPSGIRGRAIVLVLWRTGLRIGELLALEATDLAIHAPEPMLRVRRGKGGRSRTVGVHQEAVSALELWLAARARLSLERHRALFCTLSSDHRGTPLHPPYVRELLTRKAKAAGISHRVHPHAFRATLAVELHREGVPVAAIRDVLGHTNVAHTDAYLRRIFPREAVSAVIYRASS